MDSFLDDAKVNELCDMTGMTKDAIKMPLKMVVESILSFQNGEMRNGGKSNLYSPQALKDLGNVGTVNVKGMSVYLRRRYLP